MKNNHRAITALTEEIIGETGLEDVSTQDIYREIIRRFDADPTRDGLLRTPERLEKAMAEIAIGKLSLAEIAFRAGFSSQASFTRAFFRLTGVTPGEYRTHRG